MKKELFLGKNLRFLSKKDEIALTTLAKKVGMNSSTLHNYFQNVEPRNIQGLSHLSEFFGHSLDEILFTDLSSSDSGENETKNLKTSLNRGQLTINIYYDPDK